MEASIGRIERTGPISAGMVDWNTAMNRVMPPSTTSSQTMSAEFRPVCGRASIEFSIFTASAGRLTSAVVCTPVSGQKTGAGGGVVVVAAALEDVVVVAAAFGFFSVEEFQPVATGSSA